MLEIIFVQGEQKSTVDGVLLDVRDVVAKTASLEPLTNAIDGPSPLLIIDLGLLLEEITTQKMEIAAIHHDYTYMALINDNW